VSVPFHAYFAGVTFLVLSIKRFLVILATLLGCCDNEFVNVLQRKRNMWILDIIRIAKAVQQHIAQALGDQTQQTWIHVLSDFNFHQKHTILGR
jgi:hypothetical protein